MPGARALTYSAGSAIQLETVTATLGMTCLSSTVNVVGRLVINEIDYDQPNLDDGEFIEVYNGTGAPVDLADHTRVLVKGSISAPCLNVDLTPAVKLDVGSL